MSGRARSYTEIVIRGNDSQTRSDYYVRETDGLKIAQRFSAGMRFEWHNESAQRTTEEDTTMSHAYVSNLMHCIFSTKERVPLIDMDLEARLWPYLGGIARVNEMKALAIGGTTDHLHTLLSLPATMAVSKAMQLLKGGSSKWVHEAFPALRGFSWQEGYGAFSVSVSQVDRTIAYINNQKAHHSKRSFQEEFLEYLRRYAIDHDLRHVF